MKFALLTLATILLTNTHAHEAARIFDGQSATCTSESDRANTSFGAYRLNTQNVEINRLGQLSLKVQVRFLTCDQKNGNFQFVETSPLATVERETYSGTVTTTTTAATIKAYEDGIYELLLDKGLNYRSTQSVRLTKSLENLADLEEGASKNISIDFFITKAITTTSNNKEFNSVIPFGAYRVKIKVAKRNGELRAKVLN